jgi:hypothetical protein
MIIRHLLKDTEHRVDVTTLSIAARCRGVERFKNDDYSAWGNWPSPA